MADSLTEAERLDDRNQHRTMGQKLKRFFMALPRRIRTYGPDVLGTAGVVGVVIWEWRNATLGFNQLFHPGLLLAIIAGGGACLMAMWFTRLAMEAFRANKTFVGCLYAVLGLMTACVVWVGVWSNLAADSIRRGESKIELRDTRKDAVKDLRALQATLRGMDEPTGLESDKISLEKTENIGRQWGMKSLSNAAGGDCDADLDNYRRGLCSKASDLRAQIKAEQAVMDERAKIEDQIAAKQELLNVEVESTGAEHFEEMASMFGNKDDWKGWSNFVIMLISVVLLIGAAFGGDILAERRERKPVEQQ